MRLPHSLKSTHWVMWSSPVLLLVLVFTLTASSSSTPPRHLDSLTVPPESAPLHTRTPSPPTTTAPVTTTTSPISHRKRATTTRHVADTTSPTYVSTPSAPTTIAVPDKNSSGVTVSNVKSSVNASADSASSGVVSGQLNPTLDVADVPLRGPGTWNVATSAPVTVTLTCAGATIAVDGQFEIAPRTTCQVTIATMAPNRSVTWELTPVS
jgi:hypothetical protein